MEQELIEPMPEALREAGGEYNVVYTSPMAKAQKAQGAAGFFRTLQGVQEIVKITGDPSPLDNFDFDVATPAIADIQGVPESWMASPEKKAQTREGRAAAQRAQMEIQAAPAAAAMKKANVAEVEAGMRQPAQ